MKKLLLIVLLVVGCAPITFSNIQSAKLIKKGGKEYTPSLSISVNTINYGIQAAWGLNEKSNFRLRLERISSRLRFTNDNPNNWMDMTIFNTDVD